MKHGITIASLVIHYIKLAVWMISSVIQVSLCTAVCSTHMHYEQALNIILLAFTYYREL